MTSPTNRTDEVARIASELPAVACKTYKHNHHFHQVLNAHVPDSEFVWKDIAEHIASAITSAVEAERERCAKVAESDDYKMFLINAMNIGMYKYRAIRRQARLEVAKAIRQTPTKEGV